MKQCPPKRTHTSKNMSAVLSPQVEFDPVAVGGVSKGAETTEQILHQSKSKGMASGLMLALKTFLNSSNVIVPELSLRSASG